MEIIGRTFLFEYEAESYRIEVLDGTTVQWTQTKGPEEGKTDIERYILSRLGDRSVAITWIEADGLGLTNILDFEKLSVTTHANVGRDVFENAGKLVVV